MSDIDRVHLSFTAAALKAGCRSFMARHSKATVVYDWSAHLLSVNVRCTLNGAPPSGPYDGRVMTDGDVMT